MANFDNYQTKSIASRNAFNVLPLIRGIYENGVQVQALLALYQSGTDAAFNAAVNAIFTSAERNELNVMLNQINALVQDWQTNHIGAISS